MELEEQGDDVFTPQEEVRPLSVGLYCFLSQERVCGPDCMAYVTFPRKSQTGELGEQALHCILLSGAERLGRGVVALASMQAAAQKKQEIKEADTRRRDQFEPTQHATRSPFAKEKV